MRFSRWKDTRDNEAYEDIIRNINNYEQWRERIEDPIDHSILLFQITQICDDELKIDDDSIYKYSVFKFKYERLINPNNPNQDRNIRIRTLESYILIYEENEIIHFCINRTGKSALSILRKFNNIDSGEKEIIVAKDYNTSIDFINWLFYGNNILNIPDEETKLIINKITGFKGNVTSQEAIASQISGKGNEVMNALSTLAFMFETEEITYVQLKINYMDDHDFEFGLFLNGTLEFDIDKYEGSLFFGNDITKYAKVLILISTHVFPKIKVRHILASDSGFWDLNVKINKIQSIGDLIQTQVNDKIMALSNT